MKKILSLLVLLAACHVQAATCPIEYFANSAPPSDFGGIKAGSVSDAKRFGLRCVEPDSNSITVTLTGPFSFTIDSTSQTKTIPLTYDSLASPSSIEHFDVFFKPTTTGAASGTLTIAPLNGTPRIINSVPVTMTLTGTGVVQ